MSGYVYVMIGSWVAAVLWGVAGALSIWIAYRKRD